MKNRKAQFSTYLKPFIVIIFGLLMIFLVQQVLDFQLFVQEEERDISFIQKVDRDFSKITKCLKVDTIGESYVLNRSKLKRYETEYQKREPPCAEDFEYGYNVTVNHSCLEGIIPGNNQLDNCQPERYSFGEKKGSTGSSLEGSMTMEYPVLVRVGNGINVPGRLKINIRRGDLEEIAGMINRAIKNGRIVSSYSVTHSYRNSQEICAVKEQGNDKICLGSDSRCVKLRGDVNEFHLRPGSYALNMDYSQTDQKLTVKGGEQGGC